jgi:oxygen-dependent protoporphyrinogen oxidase
VKRLVVVGGGISGLAAAHAAAEHLGERARVPSGPDAVEIVVLEREAVVGGKARTAVDRGFTVETGPAGFLAPDPAIDRLVEAAGLAGDLLPADSAAARRFVVRGGRMRMVSAHPLRFVTSGILGPRAILRLLREPWVAPRAAGSGDESVWDFARRRLGSQAADRLVAPMVLGVFAGDAKRLSLHAAFPRLAALEAEHGSLMRGLLAQRKLAGSRREAGAREAAGGPAAPAGGPAGPAGRLTSFTAGIEALPRALAARVPAVVRCGVAVEAIERGPEGSLRLRLARGGSIEADAVVLACEAWAASGVLARLAPGLSALLGEISYPPVAVVALGFDAATARRVPRGFGVLVPRGEGYRALGVLWDSYIFPGRSPEGSVLVRAMLGGAVDREAGLADEASLLDWTRADLRRLLGIDAPPIFTHVHRWERAIPQYELGHGDRVRRIEAEAARQRGVFLAGNALHGVAFGKAAASGLAAGDAAAAHLTRR